MWSQHGTRFNQYQKDNELTTLPVGIYTLEYAPFAPMYLNLKQEKFEFPYKLYGTSERFPEYKNSNANLGVLLCGLKGTGKTVEAELICNLSGLPVILVTQDYDKGADLINFLSTVDQEVVVMIDEYEKIFGKAEGLLSIMDGALNARQRRLFVLTANTPYISDAMIDRPSRIHYLKKYGNLSPTVIKEVVDDMLENKDFHQQVVEYLSVIDIVTIDIVKTVVAEVNLFNEPPQHFKNFLNVTLADHSRWDLTDSEGEVLVRFATSDMVNPFTKGYNLMLKEYGDNYIDYGDITSANVKTGKIVTTKGTYVLTKSKPFSSNIVGPATMRMGAE